MNISLHITSIFTGISFVLITGSCYGTPTEKLLTEMHNEYLKSYPAQAKTKRTIGEIKKFSSVITNNLMKPHFINWCIKELYLEQRVNKRFPHKPYGLTAHAQIDRLSELRIFKELAPWIADSPNFAADPFVQNYRELFVSKQTSFASYAERLDNKLGRIHMTDKKKEKFLNKFFTSFIALAFIYHNTQHEKETAFTTDEVFEQKFDLRLIAFWLNNYALRCCLPKRTHK